MMKSKVAMPTGRDSGNLSVVVFSQVIVMWLFCDLLGLQMPREVAAAFGGIVGYVAGRVLRY